MRRTLWLVLVLLVGGCAHTIPFEPGTPDGRASVNERADRQRALVTRHDGQRHPAEALRVGADSTFWFEPETWQLVTIPTAEVASIAFPAKEGRSAEGFALGLAGGLVFGYVVGNRNYEPNIITQSRGRNAQVVGFMLSGVGAMLGLLIGQDMQNTDVFKPEDAP